MKQLSRELLESTIADWEKSRDEIPFGLGEEGDNTLAALKFALAGMAQEPVAVVECWACKQDVEVSAIGDCDGYCPNCGNPIDLDDEPYAAPPVPVASNGFIVVPVEATKEMIDAGWRYFMGAKNPSSKGTWSAMLAAAPKAP